MGKGQPKMFTNEEQRVVLYATTEQPTIPGEVTSDTPLAELNLNWRERDLPEKERTKHVHRLHPYLGKFIPQLVEIFLRKYFRPGQKVFDPFCGSGTTLVQANELGVHAVGYDISAFNILLCRAKTARYDLVQMRHEVLDILAKVRASVQKEAQQLTLWESSLPELAIPPTSNKYLHTWYAPQALYELMTYRHYLETGNYLYHDLLKVILSRSARSARLTTHFDLDFPKQPQTEPYWCYKHSRMCSPTAEAFKFIERYSHDTIRRIEAFAACRSAASVSTHNVDSRKAPLPLIDGVITSPPYVGLIDYHEQHAYAYHLLGLTDQREAEIGPAANGASQKAQQQYQHAMVTVFNVCWQPCRRVGGSS